MWRSSPVPFLLACHLTNSGVVDVVCEDTRQGCDLDGDGYRSAVDCDDSNPLIFPNQEEVCDGIDNDCDDEIDEDFDADGDGYYTMIDCDDGSDCDDENEQIHPNAVEVCDGIDSDCDGSETTDIVTLNGSNYGDLSDAISSARDGDDLFVCEGEWNESLVIDRNIRLVGVGDPESTILRAEQAQSVILIESGDVVIDGLTLTGGTGSQTSWFSSAGGGVALSTGSVLIRDSFLIENRGEIGGALYADTKATSVTLEDTIVRDNHADNYCGGIFSWAPVTLTDTFIQGNQSDEYCGGIGVYDSTLDIHGGSVEENEAEIDGGGLWASDIQLTLNDTSITGNQSSMSGGGLHLSYSDVTCSGSTTIEDNTAYDSGGGLYIQTSDLADCHIGNNSAQYGGGIAVPYYSTSTLSNLEIYDNTAINSGGGIYSEGPYLTLTLDDCDLVSNQASFGGGLYGAEDASITILGGSIIQSVAEEGGGGIRLMEGTISAVSVDLGEGIDDNDPDDLDVSGMSSPYSDLGSGTSFTCDTTTGTPTCSF